MNFPAQLLALGLLLLLARLAAETSERAHQAPVLGELLLGLALGNAHLFGVNAFDSWFGDPLLGSLAQLGAVLLLFEVGLASSVRQLLAVGGTAIAVAVVGVCASFGLGLAVATAAFPSAPTSTRFFLAALLCSTSVGITARLFRDAGRQETAEARTILGAAVVDDVLGLIILSLMASLLESPGPLSLRAAGWTLLKAAVFLGGGLGVGSFIVPRLLRGAARLRTRGVLLAFALGACFVSASLAVGLGLAAIVGAFSAGLLLEEAESKPFVERGEAGLQALIAPISGFLSPLFFVWMGSRADLSVFSSSRTVLLALLLTSAAFGGKLACGLVARKKMDALTLGLGMVPRGEIQLLFAGMLRERGAVASIVIMVLLTILLTPPALAWRLRRMS